MISENKIKRVVNVKPEYIGTSFMEHIKQQIEKDVVGECNNQIGHILNVVRIDKIIDNFIENSSSEIMVELEITVSTFKPTLGMIVDGIVKAIYNDGILAELYDKQKILIPSNTYSQINTSIGSTIAIKITAIRYTNHVFSCVGVIA